MTSTIEQKKNIFETQFPERRKGSSISFSESGVSASSDNEKVENDIGDAIRYVGIGGGICLGAIGVAKIISAFKGGED